jgi:hypothetical protein
MKLVQETPPYLSIIEGRHPRIKFHKRLSDAKHAVNLEWSIYYTHRDGTRCNTRCWVAGIGVIEHTRHRTRRGGKVYVHAKSDEYSDDWDLVYEVEPGAEIK